MQIDSAQVRPGYIETFLTVVSTSEFTNSAISFAKTLVDNRIISDYLTLSSQFLKIIYENCMSCYVE